MFAGASSAQEFNDGAISLIKNYDCVVYVIGLSWGLELKREEERLSFIVFAEWSGTECC